MLHFSDYQNNEYLLLNFAEENTILPNTSKLNLTNHISLKPFLKGSLIYIVNTILQK
jgi:hypothetical protein